MDIVEKKSDAGLTLSLAGRLDAGSAAQAETEILGKLTDEKNEIPERKLILDCSELEYISSAGLRVLLKAQKTLRAAGGEMLITNVSREVMDIFEVTGFRSIMKIQKKLREVSIQGCTRMGAGCAGECYRLDDETVLKLYYEGTEPRFIEWEKKYAQEAFVLGIPTAISYDMVSCGNRLGVVFEMLKARTLSDVMSQDLDNLEHYAEEFAGLAKSVHTAHEKSDIFPDYKTQMKGFLAQNTWMTKDEHDRFLELFDRIPDMDTCLHGDFHTSNVMVQNGELMFIDMGDFSVGDPRFDIAHVYNIVYGDFANDLGYKIMKLDREHRILFWRYFVKYYQGIVKESEIAAYEKEISVISALRQIRFIPFFPETAEGNKKILRDVLMNQ